MRALSAALMLVLLSAAPVAAQTTTPATPDIFRTDSSDLALSIQLVPGIQAVGQFDFLVAGVGDYSGQMPVRQSGPQVYHLSGSVPAQLLPATAAAASTTTLRMEGMLDPAHATSALEIWVNGQHYNLQTNPNAHLGEAGPTFDQFTQALTAQDWTTLYGMAADEIQQTESMAEFTQSMTDPSLPVIVSITPSEVGQMQTQSGINYFVQPVTLIARQPSGIMASYSATVYLVLEHAAWRFLSTTTPS